MRTVHQTFPQYEQVSALRKGVSPVFLAGLLITKSYSSPECSLCFQSVLDLSFTLIHPSVNIECSCQSVNVYDMFCGTLSFGYGMVSATQKQEQL